MTSNPFRDAPGAMAEIKGVFKSRLRPPHGVSPRDPGGSCASWMGRDGKQT